MLTGTDLGDAIERARKLKGVKKSEMARHFAVKPPSVNGWVKTGRIDKHKLSMLFVYFADVAPPSHWGLGQNDPLATSIDAVMAGVSARSRAVIEQLAFAAATGRLSEADLILMEQLAQRIAPAVAV